MQQSFNTSFLSSPIRQRIGFKVDRIVARREYEVPQIHNPPSAVPNTLAQALQQGFRTAVSTDGFPLILAKDETVYEFDQASESFLPSRRTFETVIETSWGCVAPIFANLVKDPQSDETITAVVSPIRGDLRNITVRRSQIDELHDLSEPDRATGFIKDAHHFNAVLTRPIAVSELRSLDTFHHVFPEDHDSHTDMFPCQEPYEKDDVGRIVISYRHQSYSRDRISFHDWICSTYSIEHVIKAYGWTHTRIWTDARLRQYAKNNKEIKEAPWAEIGLDPYFYGPVVVLNLSRKQSISERFWLTVERKTGAHYYGTWLTDDCGDSFYYSIPKGDELYSRSIVTSVSTSAGITWSSDREQILDLEWDQLQVTDIDHALRMLREPMTFEARQDIVDEEILEITLAEKGETIQWCGDIEALIDPPSLVEVFGSVGEISNDTQLQVIETEYSAKDTKITVVIFQESDAGNTVWIAKRLYIDDTGEIRARSIPRLCDDDYGESLSKQPMARVVDLTKATPPWLASSCPGNSRQREAGQDCE